MTFKLKQHVDELLFVPLGGSGEIGMNLNLYHLNGKWIMVDLGAGFADDYLPGASIIVPDLSFVRKIKKDLLGIVLTHSHEDHFGAIQYVLDEIECNIYATKFTATLLKHKLSEFKVPNTLKIVEIAQDGHLELGPFSIEMLSLAHSIPEMQALFIKTSKGTVMHTGDWKFDHDPLVGEQNNEKILKKYGKEGILAVVGDSTNIFNETNAGSEGDLRKSLIKLVKSFKTGMVTITTFASNIARIETIAEIAKETNRKIVVCGRSLWRLIETAKQSGYLQDAPIFYEDDAAKKFSRNEIIMIATGCQGEPLAAMSKIVSGNHQTMRFAKGDHVIFSSKIIPGNDKRIFRLFNQLVKQGVEVYTERDHFVHVSGHPGREDLTRMYDLVKPEILIPVHGEMVHMHEHARFGLEECKISKAIQVENGDVLRLVSEKEASNQAGVIGSVESGIVVIDGKSKTTPDSNVMKMRRRIMTEGVIIITILFEANFTLACDPIINCPGLLDDEDHRSWLMMISEEIDLAVSDHFASKSGNNKRGRGRPDFDGKRVEQVIRSAVRRIVKNKLGKNPPIEINMISDA